LSVNALDALSKLILEKLSQLENSVGGLSIDSDSTGGGDSDSIEGGDSASASLSI
jgi:hypothetical protein